MQIAELQIFDSSGTNVVHDGTLSQSSTGAGNSLVPALAKDGILSTYSSTTQEQGEYESSHLLFRHVPYFIKLLTLPTFLSSYFLDPYFEVTWNSSFDFMGIKIFFRSDDANLESRWANSVITLTAGSSSYYYNIDIAESQMYAGTKMLDIPADIFKVC